MLQELNDYIKYQRQLHADKADIGLKKQELLKKISSFVEDEDQELKVSTPLSNYGDDYDDSIKAPSPTQKKISFKEMQEQALAERRANQESLRNIVVGCYSLQKETKQAHKKLENSQERIDYFYDEYKKFLEFKRECGWYENTKVSHQVLKNPRLKLPSISQSNANSRTNSRRSSKRSEDIGAFILAQAEQQGAQRAGLNEEELNDQKKERARLNFLRSELTTAENYMNVQRVQPFVINQYSEYYLNKAAVREFKNHEN